MMDDFDLLRLFNIIDVIKRHCKAGTYEPKRVAAEVFDVPVEKVTPNQRMAIKQLAHGIIYGKGIDND